MGWENGRTSADLIRKLKAVMEFQVKSHQASNEFTDKYTRMNFMSLQVSSRLGGRPCLMLLDYDYGEASAESCM